MSKEHRTALRASYKRAKRLCTRGNAQKNKTCCLRVCQMHGSLGIVAWKCCKTTAHNHRRWAVGGCKAKRFCWMNVTRLGGFSLMSLGNKVMRWMWMGKAHPFLLLTSNFKRRSFQPSLFYPMSTSTQFCNQVWHACHGLPRIWGALHKAVFVGLFSCGCNKSSFCLCLRLGAQLA